MNVLDILDRLITSGDVTIDTQKCRGWSPWHQHGLRAGDVTTVTPHNRGALLQTVNLCNNAGIDYVLVGGGTATSKPTNINLHIHTGCLNSLLIDEGSQQLIAGVGVTIDQAESFVSDHGWTLGQWLGSGATATVGGAIVTDASGLLAGKYGNLREAITGVEVMQQNGEVTWLDVSEVALTNSTTILAVRIPLWLSPAGRAAARFSGAADPIRALRHVATARLDPAHLSVSHTGDITLIVEGDPHLETARYQLIVAILQKNGAVQGMASDQSKLWQELLSENPWSPNAGGAYWSDRIVLRSGWTEVHDVLARWTNRIEKAGGTAGWRVQNPTANGVQIVLDVCIPKNARYPDWLYSNA